LIVLLVLTIAGCSAFVNVVAPSPALREAGPNGPTRGFKPGTALRVVKDDLGLRAAPGSDQIAAVIPRGTTLAALGPTQRVNGTVWFEVRVPNSTIPTGWVTIVDVVASD
jgi:hypothetical protein